MDKRVKFDFEVLFTNGGSIRGQDFRLDIPVAGYIVPDHTAKPYVSENDEY